MGCGSSTVDVVVVIHSTDPLQEPTTELVKRQSKTLYQSIKWNLFKVPQDLKPFIVYFGCFTLSSVTYMYLFLQDIILIVTGTLILFMYFCPRKTIFLAFQLSFHYPIKNSVPDTLDGYPVPRPSHNRKSDVLQFLNFKEVDDDARDVGNQTCISFHV